MNRRLASTLTLTLAATLAFGTAAAQETSPAPTTRVVDGHRLDTFVAGDAHDGPTVVFENGSRETLETWDRVLHDVAPQARVFAYDRPGYGHSEPTARPRDGRTIVEDLRATLRTLGLRPPYVLVGHSLGGLYMQWFARAHPDEVAGVVLVDAVYPGVIKRPEDFPLTTRIAKHLLLNETVEREIDQIHATGDAVLALPAHDDTPMIRLFNVPKSAGAVAVDFGVVDESAGVRERVEALYPHARKVIVDSDHRIQTANPEVVVQAIRDVMAASR